MTPWPRLPLKRVAEVRGGITKGRDLNGKEARSWPYLRVVNVQDGHIDLADVAEITATNSEVIRYGLRRGDVLMNEGGDADKLGRGAVWYAEIEPCLHQNHVFCVRPTTAIEPSWLSYVTSSDPAKFYFQSKAKQTTGIASISSTNLKELPVPFPPAETQKAIADFLDRKTAAIDSLIAKKQRLLDLLAEKRAALINQAVTKGLDPSVPMKDSGIPWIGAIPAHWEVKRLKHVSGFITSGPRGWGQYYSDSGPLFLRITNVARNAIDLLLEGDKRQSVSPPPGAEGVRTLALQGDVLVTITADLGSVGVVPDGLGEAYISQHVALCIVDPITRTKSALV